jgi:hypothetical protein
MSSSRILTPPSRIVSPSMTQFGRLVRAQSVKFSPLSPIAAPAFPP